MPLEAGALLLDAVGLGAPLWALAGWTIDLLLGLAHSVANARGAVATLPAMPRWAFGLMIAGGLWLLLWSGRVRLLGLAPAAIGAVGALLTPAPDLLVTGDGRHLAIADGKGVPLLLRDRAGDYVRDLMSEAAGLDVEPGSLEASPLTHCSRDACVAVVARDKGIWRILATRSSTRIEWDRIVAACAEADIVVSDRWLPRACTPRWLKLDRKTLEQTGGVAITFGDRPRVSTVAERVGRHPWASDWRSK